MSMGTPASTTHPTVRFAMLPTLRVPAFGSGGPASPDAGPAFDRAIASLSVELEPIADTRARKLLGFAARLRSEEETLTTEAALVSCAVEVDGVEALRRRAHALIVDALVDVPRDALLFMDVRASDLRDAALYSLETPLCRIAERCVLQLRACTLALEDLSARASVLRFSGFRIAVADLDPGKACLTQIAKVSPDFVKLDARLTSGIDGSDGGRVVSLLSSICRALDAVPIAEEVSTPRQRDALRAAGCDVVQGEMASRHVPASRERFSARGR